MSTLTVTSRGQVTIRKDVLKQLLPGGRAALSAVEQNAPVRTLHGFLIGKTNGAALSIEQINDAIAKAGAKAGAGK
jgi:uncharacterized protein YqeY